MQGKMEHAPRHHKDINKTPYAPQDGYPLSSIHRRAAEDQHKEEDGED
jgi:hypothetical protein